MNASRRLLAFLLPGLLLQATCQAPVDVPETPPSVAAERAPQQDPDERAIVLETLQAMKQDALRNAFAALPHYRYTRYTRTEQGDATHPRTAFAEHVIRIDREHGVPTFTVLETDSAGVFSTGAPGSPVSKSLDEQTTASLPEYVLLDDPPYLAPRNRDAFLYRLLPDTVYWNAPTQVIEVKASPGEGDTQAIRRTRLYLDRASNELVAVYIERAEQALFFDEASRFYLRLRPASDGRWVPFTNQFQTHLRLPLRAPQHIRTVSTYYLYEPAS